MRAERLAHRARCGRSRKIVVPSFIDFTVILVIFGMMPILELPVYRKMIKPKQRRLVEAIKSKTDAKIYYHSCGAVFDLIPDLIELGFDILNPVQVSARGMDTRRLKEEYGTDITFWGGIDTQHVMPFGKPEEVADEVKRRIDDLAPGGGFVFATVHNIQAFVPPENIVAAYETALEYGKY